MTNAYLVATPIWQINIANTIADENGQILGSVCRMTVDPKHPITNIKIILSDGSSISAPRDHEIPVVRFA